LCLARTDAKRCKSERPGDSCSGCDPLQFHRELLYRLAASPHTGESGKALTTVSDAYIVPPAAFIGHIDCGASFSGQLR
jgi:hypothetical protein